MGMSIYKKKVKQATGLETMMPDFITKGLICLLKCSMIVLKTEQELLQATIQSDHWTTKCLY